MKTISIRLEDHVYDELDEMLGEMGQSKQSCASREKYTFCSLRPPKRRSFAKKRKNGSLSTS